MKMEISKKENSAFLFLHCDLYSLEAIYNAAYSFLDKVYIFFSKESSKKIKIKLKAKEKREEKEIEILAGNFLNEVINTGLREMIYKENKNIGKIMLGAALLSSSRNLQEEVRKKKEENDNNSSHEKSNEDPLGIAVPWEEKYEK